MILYFDFREQHTCSSMKYIHVLMWVKLIHMDFFKLSPPNNSIGIFTHLKLGWRVHTKKVVRHLNKMPLNVQKTIFQTR